MKKIFLCLVLALVFLQGKTQTEVPDGIYIADSLLTSDKYNGNLKANQKLLFFHPDFADKAPNGVKAILVSTIGFVPLEFDAAPQLVSKSGAGKKVLLSFSKNSADKLSSLTSKHIMHQATIVVRQQALTMNKIRAAIAGGKMEITESDGKSCDLLFAILKRL
jgi:hypothetical protein